MENRAGIKLIVKVSWLLGAPARADSPPYVPLCPPQVWRGRLHGRGRYPRNAPPWRSPHHGALPPLRCPWVLHLPPSVRHLLQAFGSSPARVSPSLSAPFPFTALLDADFFFVGFFAAFFAIWVGSAP